ncbi:polyprenyl synthetase family protein [Secundilactobacillus paracollinoides]|uniref:polyprenyl synthetase family protein n=1 Tax=Secundilactobacillus paracollinoides TaxID=240427 RepID=UPI0006EF41F4|nr:farnesyl diphosphate synthase [Secundilactobacillus paracollinoides]KRL76440.1 farnesyltranstransferase [Secundilactobacillus paracollinoides DSM 15502 = JCM 11969]
MTISKQLATFEANFRPLINTYLTENLPKDVDQSILSDAMAYSVNAGGKLLRPLLTLAVLVAAGQSEIATGQLRAASALELLHTYSLIHDDLPAMDNDDLRRGVPTNHVKFGAGMATLAGDGLLTLAFQWVADNDLPADQKLALVNALAVNAGPSGMVAGQADDISNEHHQLALPALENLHRHKTGALLHYAVQAGCIMAQTTPQETAALLTFADQFGLAFQIYDDLLDVTSTAEQLGKRVHKDAQESKNTYPGLFGVEGTKTRLAEVVAAAKTALEPLSQDSQLDVTLLTAFLSYFQIEG